MQEYSNYFLDHQEHDDETIRWTDRIYTSLGDWSGNVYDFYCRVSGRIAQLAKKPYVHDGEARIDDTPIRKTLNEALVNALLHANYYDRRGLVIHRRPQSLTIANPHITIDELTASLGVSRRTVLRRIKALRDSGTLNRIGSDKTGYWQILK